MAKRQKPREVEQESPEYVEDRARELVAAVGKREARRVLAGYKARADDPKVSKHGRKIAAQRG